MELDQLRHFVSVARHGSFSRAAGDCHLSQPALSRSIQKLEATLGRPLLDRTSRGVVLTEAGSLLLARAREVLALTADIRCAMKDDGVSGVIRVGAIPTVAPYLLPSVIRGFAARYPQARIQVREDVTQRLLVALEDGQLDLAIMALPLETTLEVTRLYEEELLLVLPRAHPLVDREKIAIADLAGHPLILLEASHCLSGNVREICHAENLSSVSVEMANQILMIQELVALSHGISFIPRLARERDSSPDRVYRSLEAPRPARTIVRVQDPRRYRSRLLQAFDRHLREHEVGPRSDPPLAT